ncbi:MAG: sigma-70 family RNA polymerase sigma factor [Bacteroidetes bacterium]|nr:MAG: sigma-70 family RNA polymerase sigma factor [Bacteroidota bacterium]
MLFSARRTYRKLDDHSLISEFRAHPSPILFSVIYERYAHLVLGVCLKYLKDEEEAKDLSADIFEKLGQRILKQEIQYFKAWLFQLCKNECLMLLRKKKHYFIPTDLIQIESEADRVDAKVEQETRYKLLEEAMGQLKEQQVECLRLFFFKDMSYQEISSSLQMDLKKVKSHIQNGKRMLKLSLSDHEEFRNK